MGRPAKHNAGFDFSQSPVLKVRFEPPLSKGICDGFCLARKRAEKMNVFYLASFVDDDPDGNRVKRALGENRIDPRHHVLVAGVVLDAHRKSSPTRSGRGSGLLGHLHLIHVEKQTF